MEDLSQRLGDFSLASPCNQLPAVGCCSAVEQTPADWKICWKHRSRFLERKGGWGVLLWTSLGIIWVKESYCECYWSLLLPRLHSKVTSWNFRIQKLIFKVVINLLNSTLKWWYLGLKAPPCPKFQSKFKFNARIPLGGKTAPSEV